mmetsp:Transcript_19064/g.24247  ORF Transcript_19064/g.24247 Transcript_19064/m.24247 type:complete len:85 (-) Transcript_19064:812-1066(-)
MATTKRAQITKISTNAITIPAEEPPPSSVVDDLPFGGAGFPTSGKCFSIVGAPVGLSVGPAVGLLVLFVGGVVSGVDSVGVGSA